MTFVFISATDNNTFDKFLAELNIPLHTNTIEGVTVFIDFEKPSTLYCNIDSSKLKTFVAQVKKKPSYSGSIFVYLDLGEGTSQSYYIDSYSLLSPLLPQLRFFVGFDSILYIRARKSSNPFKLAALEVKKIRQQYLNRNTMLNNGNSSYCKKIIMIVMIILAVVAHYGYNYIVLPMIPSKSEAVKLVYEGENPVIDIVLVHGVEGDGDLTWSHDGIYWPKAFLSKDFPNSRIFVYDYNNYISGWSGYSMGLSARAENFYAELESWKIGVNKRVIFIGHSMGGLVIKKTLLLAHLRSEDEGNTYKLLPLVSGIIFMAVPHLGADIASFLSWIEVVTKANVNLKELSTFSTEIENMHYESTKLVQKYPKIGIKSFCEQKPTSGIMVVDYASCKLSGFPKDQPVPFMEDHSSITKFSSNTHAVYRQLRDALQKWIPSKNLFNWF